MKQVVVYVHGKGGSSEEANHYKSLFKNSDVIGYDYKSTTPWDAKKEFKEYFDTLKENDTFTNHTKSIGTYFGVTAEANSKWTTITHIPEEKHEVVLPRTGK